MNNVASLIRQSRQENRTITVYPATPEETAKLLEDLGAEAADDCSVWEHHSGSGYSGPESVGHYEAWGDDWRVDVVSAEVARYTYSIFDADPNSSTGTDWPGHSKATLWAADLSEAEERVREIMSEQSYYDDDGYEAGQRIYSLIWDDAGRSVADPSYVLTAEDIA